MAASQLDGERNMSAYQPNPNAERLTLTPKQAERLARDSDLWYWVGVWKYGSPHYSQIRIYQGSHVETIRHMVKAHKAYVKGGYPSDWPMHGTYWTVEPPLDWEEWVNE